MRIKLTVISLILFNTLILSQNLKYDFDKNISVVDDTITFIDKNEYHENLINELKADTIKNKIIVDKNLLISKIDFSNYVNNNNKFYESNLFKALIGSSIVLGTITAYYKINADKIYDEYSVTKNPSTLKKVNKYDLISGISFTLLQINFGYLIYKFLTD
ncbi:MAG: hypothetical protein N2321_08850 [Melioribacteraceae bacterium]|nr:hypothetical protein [Melioribacteraceae bacterium]